MKVRAWVFASALRAFVALAGDPLFSDATAQLGHTHVEKEFDDFQRQLLLPRRLSQLGPGIAWCDLNGDGCDDLVIGSGAGGLLSIRLAAKNGGQFRELTADEFKAPADTGGVVAWRARDGVDWILAGLSNYEDENEKREAVRGWEIAPDSGRRWPFVPGNASSAGPIACADIDGDGDVDLFVGGRCVPGRWPEPAASRLALREGATFVPDERNAALLKGLGMVSGAVFTDLNGDGAPDLALAIEWGPVRVLLNDGKGTFTDATKKLGLAERTGWWNGIAAGDLDGDGRLDLVVTNWGRNTKYEHRFDARHPLRVFFGELDVPGRLDVIEAYTDPATGKLVPERGFPPSAAGLPFIKERIKTFKQFGESTLEEIYGAKLEQTQSLAATTLEHTLLLNRRTSFEARALPLEAQFAPAFGVTIADLDGDGAEDVVLAQNFFAMNPETPRLDAGRGLLLRGDGSGGFKSVPGQESGILVYGEGRGLAVGDFDGDRRLDLAIAQNGATTRLFRNAGAPPMLRIDLHGSAGNPQAFGAVVRAKFGAKKFGPAREIHGGGGYWSQDSATPLLGGAMLQSIWVRWPGGVEGETRVPPGATSISLEAPAQ